MRETVDGCFDPLVCLELPDNWEDMFFQVAYERGEEKMLLVKGGSEDEIDEPPANAPKIALYQEATSGFLQDILHFPETKGNMKTANELAKVIANVESDWLKQRRS